MEQTGKTVPVFVDNSGYASDFGMTRLTYFYVECAESDTTAPIESKGDLPILLMDLEGILMSPFGGKEKFDSAEDIGRVLDHIDNQTPYVVSTSYFWLPTELIKDCLAKEPSRGDVLRVSTPLFVQACRHIRTPMEFNIASRAPGDKSLYFSEKETQAFREWTDQMVDRVRDRYYKNTAMNLRERHQRKGV